MASEPPSAEELVPYSEVVAAPTARAKCCACKRKKAFAPQIELGELKFVSYYLPNGRNHLENTSTRLACVSQKTAKAILEGRTEKGEIKIAFEAESDAYKAIVGIAQAIASGKPPPEALASARFPPPAKPRAKPKRKHEEDE